MHALVIASGKHKGRRIELPDRQVLIGRDENCLVRMTSAEVSQQHCSLTPAGDGLVVRDCNSQNGTFVNLRRITSETALVPGDILQIGPVQFLVEGPPEGSAGNVEDSVLSWLSDDGSAQPGSTGDTTVVKMPPQLQPPPIESRTAKFKTVAEEAHDIIREWQNLQQRHSPSQ